MKRQRCELKKSNVPSKCCSDKKTEEDDKKQSNMTNIPSEECAACVAVLAYIGFFRQLLSSIPSLYFVTRVCPSLQFTPFCHFSLFVYFAPKAFFFCFLLLISVNLLNASFSFSHFILFCLSTFYVIYYLPFLINSMLKSHLLPVSIVLQVVQIHSLLFSKFTPFF